MKKRLVTYNAKRRIGGHLYEPAYGGVYEHKFEASRRADDIRHGGNRARVIEMRDVSVGKPDKGGYVYTVWEGVQRSNRKYAKKRR